MTASIISIADLRKKQQPVANSDGMAIDEPVEAYIGCIMTTAYALAGSLLVPTRESAPRYLAKFIDDPTLLTKIAAHGDKLKLSKLLLAAVLLEHARDHLWGEIEGLISDPRAR
jgi:hypothetical protein